MEITVVHKPRRKAVIRRGVRATHYFEYCVEIGCNIWEQLLSLPFRAGQPVCLWLPEKLIAPASLGFEWDEENPRIQLEPQCERGYMELKAVRKKIQFFV